jgi:hypothetical protein
VKPKRKRSAAEIRRGQIALQLERLRFRLASIRPSQYSDEPAYRRELGRARDLLSELEGELSMLDCPGEYAELPAAVVADELGVSYEQVRDLVKLGEIAATGRTAHERISRVELERVAALGPAELIRLSRQESSEIFEQAILLLQGGDLKEAERAYQRLDARLSWRGPYAPAFLVGLELAKGDFNGALSSVKLIHEHNDLLLKMMTVTYLGRVLRGMSLSEKGAQEMCEMLAALADEVAATGRVRTGVSQRRENNIDGMQWQAAYLATSVMGELRKRMPLKSHADPWALEQEVGFLIRNALYTALYAEAFYADDTACKLYADMTRAMTPKELLPATLLIAPSGKGRRARR